MLDPVSAVALPDYSHIADRLGDQGWCVVPGFLPATTTASLAAEVEEAWQSGCFRHAGVGRGQSWELRPEVRSDKVLWLDQASCTPSQAQYLDQLEQLRQVINSRLFLGLFDFEGHHAVYPPGACYRKHVDQFRDLGTRLVTCVLYLNPQWHSSWGGALRLYLEPGGEGAFLDIPPQGGQLVTFLSRDFYHEVLPATRNRFSIAGWFRRRGQPGSPPLPGRFSAVGQATGTVC
jgi:SM-20-related protein